MHISKHSLFRLKITVGCRLCTCPSIHFSLDEDTLKITVGCLVCGVVCVWCVVVVRVCCCVVKLGTHSLSLSLALSPSSSLSLSFSLFSFFFSLSLAPSLTLALALVLSLSLSLLSSFFFPPFYSLYSSLLSSLPFTPTNTVQSTDQQSRRPTLRRLNVMWRTVRSKQLPTNCTECSHLCSFLLFSPPSSLPPTPRKKKGDFLLQEYYQRGNYFVLQFYINSERLNLHHVKSVIISAVMVSEMTS